MSSSPPASAGVAAVTVLLGMIFVGVIFGPSLPLLSREHLGMDDVDSYGTQWFFWYVGEQLSRGQLALQTDLFFYPFGKDLLRDTGANIIDAVLAWPLRSLWGPVLGHNLFILATLVGSAWAFAWMAKLFVQAAAPRWVGGLLFALSPYILLELKLGRVTQAILVLLPLLFRAMWRLGEQPDRRRAIGVGILFTLLGYQYWFYAIFAGLIFLVWLGMTLYRAGRSERGPLLKASAQALGLSMILCLPVVLPTLQGNLSEEHAVSLRNLDWTYQGDLSEGGTEGLTQVEISSWQPLSRSVGISSFSRSLQGEFLPGQPFPSWTMLMMILGWCWWGRSPRTPLSGERALPLRVWAGLSSVPLFLCMGPKIWIGSLGLPNLPYLLLVELSVILGRLWWPSRALGWMTLFMVLAVTLCLERLRRRSGAIFCLGAALVLGGELALHHQHNTLPMPSWDAAVSEGYHCLAEAPAGAVMDLPFQNSASHVYAQTIHGKPLMGGMAEGERDLEPPEHRAMREDNDWLGLILRTTDTELPTRRTQAEGAEQLRELGYRYFIVRKQAYAQQDENIARRRLRKVRKTLAVLLKQPVYEDESLIIYAPWLEGSFCSR